MSVLFKDAVQWSEAERMKALKRIVPARAIRSVLVKVWCFSKKVLGMSLFSFLS